MNKTNDGRGTQFFSNLLRKKWIRRVVVINFLLGMLAAAVLVSRIANTKVDVGLDLENPTGTPPAIVAGDGQKWDAAPIVMEKITDRFAPAKERSFKLIATGMKSPRSQGTEVWVNEMPANLVVQQNPPVSWERNNASLVSSGQQPAQIQWRGTMEKPSLILGMHQYSGIARLVTSQYDKTIDLFYDNNDSSIEIPLDAQPKPASADPNAVDYYFELTATGGKNPASGGSEVWLKDFPQTSQLMQDPPGTWERKGKDLVCSGKKPSTLYWRGRPEVPWIVLGRHGFSGMARLKLLSAERTVDLYDPKGSVTVLSLADATTGTLANVTLKKGAGQTSATLQGVTSGTLPGGGAMFFELHATGAKNPASKGHEVWLKNFPKLDETVQDPPNTWTRQGADLVFSGATSSTLRWRGMLAQPQITLGKHDWSGMVRTKTRLGERDLDLYDAVGSVLVLPLDSITSSTDAGLGLTSGSQNLCAFELTATGTKGARSKGCEVWLKGFPKLDEVMQDPPNTWTRQGPDLVYSGNGKPSTLRWRGSLDVPKIMLGKHDWSGIAWLKTRLGEQELDLYDPAGAMVTMPLDNITTLSTTGALKECSFELIATGAKSANSKGCEIWLNGFPKLEEVVQDPPNSWNLQGMNLVYSGGKPSTLRWHGKLEKPQIALGKHEWSGIARLKTGGQERELDLYDPQGSVLTLPLDVGAPCAPRQKCFFELTVLPERNPLSGGGEIWISEFPDVAHVQMSPAGAWTRRGPYLTYACEKDHPADDEDLDLAGQGAKPASDPALQPTLRWEGTLDRPSLVIVKHPWSGMVKVKTVNGESVLDLYQPATPTRNFNIPPSDYAVRYHAQIPRRLLGALSIKFADAAAPSIRRIYVGSLLPTVYLVKGQDPGATWGRLLQDWVPILSRDGQGYKVNIEVNSPLETGSPLSFLGLTLILSVLGLALSAGLWLAWRLLIWLLRAESPRRMLAPLSHSNFLMFFIPLVGVWLVYLGAFYPAIMSLDAMDVWNQMTLMYINDQHPALNALCMWLCTRLWYSPAAAALVHIVLLAGCFAYALELLLRARVSGWVVVLLFLAALVSPHNGLMAVTVIKDTRFTIVLFIGVLMLARVLLDNRTPPRFYFWILLGVVLALPGFFRHNGMLITVGLFPLLPIFFWRQLRYVMLTMFFMVLTYCGIKYGLYPACYVQGRSFKVSSASMGWSTAALVTQDVPFRQDEYDFLGQIRAFDDKWLYTPTTGATMVWGDRNFPYNFDFAQAHAKEFVQKGKSLLVRYPLLFLRHLCQVNAYLYWVPRTKYTHELTLFDSFLDNYQNEAMTAMKSAGFPMQPLLPGVKLFLGKVLMPTFSESSGNHAAWGWLLWRPALRLYLLLLAVAVGAWRTRDYRLLLLCLPAVLNTLSLSFGAPQEVRYQYAVVAMTGFLLGIAFLPKRGDVVREVKVRESGSKDAAVFVGCSGNQGQPRTEE